MVRRDGKILEGGIEPEGTEPRCTFPAGESPAPAGTGAPGSRTQQRSEMSEAERVVKSLERGSKEAGRNQMKVEQASSHYQPKGDWERGSESSPRVASKDATCRAGHVAAKADAQRSVSPGRALGFPGVLAAARFEGEERNTRDPSARPTSGKDRTHKARAESFRSAAGVRGARGTDEGGNKPLEGRGPALVTLELKVSARACR